MTIKRKFAMVRGASQPDVGIRSQWWRRMRILAERVLRLGRREPRRLRLCESLPLGERRFVAVVEFERSRFLVGGTTASLALLARLEDSDCAANTTRVDEDDVDDEVGGNEQERR
jgi:flagellar biogenesis protein FliO